MSQKIPKIKIGTIIEIEGMQYLVTYYKISLCNKTKEIIGQEVETVSIVAIKSKEYKNESSIH